MQSVRLGGVGKMNVQRELDARLEGLDGRLWVVAAYPLPKATEGA